MRPAVYNEVDPFCCDVLRARIADGSLPPGDVDDRDIREVQADDYRGYGQIHLFAGIGGFGYAARLAGLPDGFDVLTGGFPCQPWSVAGKRGGSSDDRHLWPEMLRLVRALRPQRVLGENVPGLDDAEYMALDGVLSDLEGAGYEGWPIEVPACGVDAPHVRNRLWIVAHAEHGRVQVGRGVEGACKDDGRPSRVRGDVGSSCEQQTESVLPDRDGAGCQEQRRPLAGGEEYTATECGCGWKAEPAVGRVVDGLPRRVDRLKSLGNAIVPQVAAEIMRAMREAV